MGPVVGSELSRIALDHLKFESGSHCITEVRHRDAKAVKQSLLKSFDCNIFGFRPEYSFHKFRPVSAILSKN